MDKLLVVCGPDGEPERCIHGRPYTEIPPNFKGLIIRVIYPEWWGSMPQPCGCGKNQHNPST